MEDKFTFNCTKCQNTVHISPNDYPHFQNRGFICNDCYSIFASILYQKNVKGRIALFSPQPGALGDGIMFSSIVKCYQEDNPDEDIYLMAFEETYLLMDLVKKLNPVKIFWADNTNWTPVPQNLDLIQFSIVREARAIAENRHIYPSSPQKENLDFEPAPGFVLYHTRNIRKLEWKNIQYGEYIATLQLLKDVPVYLVGNDPDFEFDEHLETYMPNVKNLRRKLTIGQIATLAENASVCIGKDSGVQHLAAAAKGRVIAYGYKNEHWKPLTQYQHRIKTFDDGAEGFFKFLMTLKNALHLL